MQSRENQIIAFTAAYLNSNGSLELILLHQFQKFKDVLYYGQHYL